MQCVCKTRMYSDHYDSKILVCFLWNLFLLDCLYLILIICSFVKLHRFTTGLADTLLLWPTITEQIHQVRNVYRNLDAECPTAKTDLLGGGAFVSLDSSLFWLVCLMLADNAREDYFDETGKVGEGEQGQVFVGDYIAPFPAKGSVSIV